jgi:hypothetical protein
MIKLYLDWNIISGMKNDDAVDLQSVLNQFIKSKKNEHSSN